MTKTIRSEGHEALCQALIDARKAAGLTQAELAQRLRCHQSFVARIESGERRVDVIELVAITRAIEVTTSEILKVVEEATPADHRI
ncbi:XRE family transcriptional regulator [Palleronia sediminis]|uniref:XRE family transcriptional regulator n=1 Tax=Palleronia sediminis TaxID=2547833 RepID=A0A4R5ZXH5_9RHOB|nr:helix-turn-helix transcriptional regulator [Palleronia sediminis]TDL74892.1 XRE family transcriptional regulator [Palleronia sediminis]